MASYTNRGTKAKPSWQYIISRMVNGKSKPIRKGGFKTKKEAEVAASEIENQLNKGINPHLKLEPFNEYFKKWYDLYKKNIASTTLAHYDYTYDAITNHFESTYIQHIDRRDYQKFINSFGKDRAKETVSKVNSHIRSCVLDAIEEGVIHRDFTRKVNIHYTVEAKKKHEKHLNFGDSKKLMNEVVKRLDDGMSYYAIMLALASGLRYSELIGLTRDDFDFKNNRINVNKTWGTNNSMDFGFNDTKNSSSERTVKVSDKVMLEFKKLFLKTTTNEYGLVFYNASSKYKVISNEGINKTLRKVLRDLGIQTITLHGLRHTYASVLLYKRISLGYVAESLGHANTIKTQENYAHVLAELEQEDGKKTTEIFDSMLVHLV